MGTKNERKKTKSQKATIIDIARESGTSISTVSYVINNGPRSISKETREKVLSVIKRCSYSPDRIARSLKRRKTMSIGVIFPDMTNIYFPETLGGILEVTQHEKYNIILRDASSDTVFQEECIRDLIAQRVDGFIIRPVERSPVPKILEKSGIPFVVVDRPEGEWKEHDSVYANNRAAIKMAALILLEEGHSRIALITGPEDSLSSQERAKGFQDAYTEKKRSPSEGVIFWGPFSRENGMSSMHSLFKDYPRVTAVISGSTKIAFGVLEALKKEGKSVGRDISVVAYGYSKWLSLHYPPITTIEQPVREMGRRAAQIILAAIGDSGRPGKRVNESVSPVRFDGISHQIHFEEV